jgi:hypothetical protein
MVRDIHWVECDDPDNGHGIQFFHDKLWIEDKRPACIAFLVGYGWRDGGPATVRLLAVRPPSVASDHWSEMMASVREAVRGFLLNEGMQTPQFRKGPVGILFNA